MNTLKFGSTPQPSNGMKYKQFGPKYGTIGARETAKTAEKACTYGGGADV